MRRAHGLELHEQEWMPETIRTALTEWLRAFWEYSRAATAIAPLLRTAILSSGAGRIVDLCSGRSGPAIPVQAELARSGVEVPVILTDKFGAIKIDARSVPAELTGMRTLFNSFHHVRPDEARRILEDACLGGQPIGVFEITSREWPKVLMSFPASFIGCFLLLPRVRPVRASWWIFTWLIPVIPLVIGWDGLISHLRAYKRSEIEEMTRGLGGEEWTWEQGRVAAPRGGVTINYMIGRPAAR